MWSETGSLNIRGWTVRTYLLFRLIYDQQHISKQNHVAMVIGRLAVACSMELTRNATVIHVWMHSQSPESEWEYETDISVCRRNKCEGERLLDLTFIMWTQAWLQMNANVAARLFAHILSRTAWLNINMLAAVSLSDGLWWWRSRLK